VHSRQTIDLRDSVCAQMVALGLVFLLVVGRETNEVCCRGSFCGLSQNGKPLPEDNVM